MDTKFKSIITGFINSAQQFPEHRALVVNDQVLTYRELAQAVSNLSNTIQERERSSQPFAAFLAYRSVTAYAGVLGILASGKGYVPLNPNFPLERTQKMLTASGCNVLIADKDNLETLAALLKNVTRPLTVILPEFVTTETLCNEFPQHQFVTTNEMSTGPAIPEDPKSDPEDIAYLLFTSGSTGEPKAVPVCQKNVTAYARYFCDTFRVTEHDRFSQNHDMTFDFSVHDLFVPWERGACVCCVPKKSVMAPAKFIKENQITFWASVPSVIIFLSNLRMLKPGVFPSIRFSMFCGEPLTASAAQAWQEAAPNSIVENFYGPTEATVAITHYKWDSQTSPEQCLNGVVPIGWMFKGQKCCIINENRQELPMGEVGELCLSGTQVINGYYKNPEKNKQQFIQIPSRGEAVWYRTGDLAKQDENGCLYYFGRIDNQVQILGHRVELQEIDHVLRKTSNTELAISIAWPINQGIAEGVVAFICRGNTTDAESIRRHCEQFLPDYMVPREVHFIDSMPINNNGKIDRLKLVKILQTSS